MKLALRELVRRPDRFLTAIAILTLIAILLMFLGGLLDGLTRNNTGAVRAQDVDAFVFSRDSRASFLRSRIDPELRSTIESAVAGEVGGVGVVLLGARVPGNDPRDLANVAVLGYELASDGLPSPPAPGEAYADTLLRADGVELGDELLLGPARSPVKVIGWVSDTAFNGQGGLWVELDTWHSVLDANRPGAALADDVVQAVVVRTDPGSGGTAADTIASIEAAAGAQVLALTVEATIDEIPGVVEQRRTFNQILAVTVVIALVVVALFFALLTVERSALYGVLKALGARSLTLFGGLVTQAAAVTLVAATIAGGAVIAIEAVIPPGSVPLYVSPSRIISSVALMLGAAIAGSAFSLRRVLRVDPASALGSSS